MTKFSGSSDPGFVRVAATLARWVDNLKARAESDGLKILQRTRVDTDAVRDITIDSITKG